jgi:N-acetylglucosamine-6-phosphate deacetylase
MISDSMGIHVHPDLQRMVLKCKGIERVVLITDSTCSNGTPPEKYAHVKDINFSVNGAISGSKLTMDKACFNMKRHSGLPAEIVWRMASEVPARMLGLCGRIGALMEGADADIVIADRHFNVRATFVGGTCVYKAQ